MDVVHFKTSIDTTHWRENLVHCVEASPVSKTDSQLAEAVHLAEGERNSGKGKVGRLSQTEEVS